jgi:hypothetical protein
MSMKLLRGSYDIIDVIGMSTRCLASAGLFPSIQRGRNIPCDACHVDPGIVNTGNYLTSKEVLMKIFNAFL